MKIVVLAGGTSTERKEALREAGIEDQTEYED